MTNLFDIFNYYESIKQKNLFTDSIFSVDSIFSIEENINSTNDKFFSLLKKQALENNVAYRALQIVYNDLVSIYKELEGRLKNFHLYNIEQTPLFRFKIVYDSTLLSNAYSRIVVLNGISEIYWYLEKHFSDKIIVNEPLYELNYTPPYINEYGYIKHIYAKFLQDDFLEKELYGNKIYWVKKIDEFLNYIPSEINLSLPIDYLTNRFNNEPHDATQRNELQKFLDTFGVISENKGWLSDPLNKWVRESQTRIDGYEEPAKTKATPLFLISDSFKKNKNGTDYIKDLFFSLRDTFKLLDSKTKLSTFKHLFSGHVVIIKIVVNDAKKLLAIIKFLKVNHVIKPHHQYIKIMVTCFEEPRGKSIDLKSLYGSKFSLTLDEEKKLKQLFNL